MIWWLLLCSATVLHSANVNPTVPSFGFVLNSIEDDNEVLTDEESTCPSDVTLLDSILTIPIFKQPCKTNLDCNIPGDICCRSGEQKLCRRGVTQSIPEPKHLPLLPGIPRRCPKHEAIVEILPVKSCTKDEECGPRICCPAGRTGYCRTAVHSWNEALPAHLVQTLNNMVSYLQCTSPPPPLLDLFPRPCRNMFDCFPNLCCQERGHKVCRPAKRSLPLALLRFLTTAVSSADRH